MADRYSRFSSWYCEDLTQTTTDGHNAEQVFAEAVKRYTQQITRDSKKMKRFNDIQASSMSDVIAEVNKARDLYETKRSDGRTKKYIVEVSKRLVFYGNVMDAMVQQSPEYVSLAYGTMKLLFGAIVENEKIGSTISTGLCEIADALPRTELFLELYPTEAMKAAVATQYTWILRFLTRALKWYGEGRIRHALTAVVNPAALQYDDIVSGIRQSRDSMSNQAAANSLAEQRDMHERLRTLQLSETVVLPGLQAQHKETQVIVTDFRDRALSGLSKVEKRQDQASKKLAALTLLVEQLRETTIVNQAINAQALLHLSNNMSGIQLSQALRIVSSSISVDHLAILQQSIQLRDRRRVKWRQYVAGLESSSTFRRWNVSPSSGSIGLKSTFKERNLLGGSLASIIEQLKQSRIAVLWALKSHTQDYDSMEILKSMIYQALMLDSISHTDVMFSVVLRRYLDTRTEEEYVSILGEILSHFKLIYIVVQAEAMTSGAAGPFRRYMDSLLEEFERRASGQILKIIIASYGPPSTSPEHSSDRQVLRIRGKWRKSGRTPGNSLISPRGR